MLDREPTRLPGGRPGLLKLLSIERLGVADDGPAESDEWDEGW